jgi:hypothetical protein
MSRKINRFAGIITQPLNIYNFQIVIKNRTDEVDSDILLTVQSTEMPSEQMREMILYHQGEAITYPAKPQLGGDWTFTIPEGDKGQIRNELDRLKDAVYDQKTGKVTPRVWYDIEVFQKDLSDNIVFSSVLHGAWLKGRGKTDLKTEDVQNSWQLTYTFHYTWLEEKRTKNLKGSPNPIMDVE